ncbi:MAG TPA: hypothetical protein VG734_10795 [Lacunisphaera sp.]|nr:hypothetical protein [Lacunisphaera sp.]
MKFLPSFFTIVAASAGYMPAQEAIRPAIASESGNPVVVQAEFVAKPNDYYSQNMVVEPYALKVVAVNGRALEQPVLMEYNLHLQGKERARIERRGSVATFEAYESLYQPGIATPWLADGQQGRAFALVHVLHIRPLRKKG